MSLLFNMLSAAAAAAKLLQSCLTLCDPTDSSPPGSSILGILQARTMAWVAISFSNEWKWKLKVKLLSHVRPSATPWTAAFQAPPSMGFSRQEYWSGMPLPSPDMLSRLVITSLPRGKCLLISWLLLLLSHFSRVQLCATPETAAHEAPPSLGFSRQEHWSGLLCLLTGDLPDLGTEPRSPALQVDSLSIWAIKEYAFLQILLLTLKAVPQITIIHLKQQPTI